MRGNACVCWTDPSTSGSSFAPSDATSQLTSLFHSGCQYTSPMVGSYYGNPAAGCFDFCFCFGQTWGLDGIKTCPPPTPTAPPPHTRIHIHNAHIHMHTHTCISFRSEFQGRGWAETWVAQEAYVTSTACGIIQPLGPRVKGEGPPALCLEALRTGQGTQEKALPCTPFFSPLVSASELMVYLPGPSDPPVIKLLKGLK